MVLLAERVVLVRSGSHGESSFRPEIFSLPSDPLAHFQFKCKACPASMGDRVTINCGGRHFETSTTTLQASGSHYFAALFGTIRPPFVALRCEGHAEWNLSCWIGHPAAIPQLGVASGLAAPAPRTFETEIEDWLLAMALAVHGEVAGFCDFLVAPPPPPPVRTTKCSKPQQRLFTNAIRILFFRSVV